MKLKSGAVLPSGLYSVNRKIASAAFNKKFNNFPIRSGIVSKRLDPSDPANISGFIEYEVIVTEQTSDGPAQPQTYHNCIAIDSFGGMADFFQSTFRFQTKVDADALGYEASGQDGDYVIIACLNGQATTAIILGGLQHPDRQAEIGEGNSLLGVFNGVGLQILNDGSTQITFNGATDNTGKPITPLDAPTTLGIAADGSLTISNQKYTLNFTASGQMNLTLKDAVSVKADKDISIDTQQNFNLTTQQKVSVTSGADLAMEAQGSCSLKAQSFTFNADSDFSLNTQTMEIQAQIVDVQATEITLQGLCFVGGPGGLPALTMATQYLGISAVGPVFSSCIGPFATQTFVL